jgi:hypothetical protein
VFRSCFANRLCRDYRPTRKRSECRAWEAAPCCMHASHVVSTLSETIQLRYRTIISPAALTFETESRVIAREHQPQQLPRRSAAQSERRGERGEGRGRLLRRVRRLARMAISGVEVHVRSAPYSKDGRKAPSSVRPRPSVSPSVRPSLAASYRWWCVLCALSYLYHLIYSHTLISSL